jgi:hypothetical protein
VASRHGSIFRSSARGVSDARERDASPRTNWRLGRLEKIWLTIGAMFLLTATTIAVWPLASPGWGFLEAFTLAVGTALGLVGVLARVTRDITARLDQAERAARQAQLAAEAIEDRIDERLASLADHLHVAPPDPPTTPRVPRLPADSHLPPTESPPGTPRGSTVAGLSRRHLLLFATAILVLIVLVVAMSDLIVTRAQGTSHPTAPRSANGRVVGTEGRTLARPKTRAASPTAGPSAAGTTAMPCTLPNVAWGMRSHTGWQGIVISPNNKTAYIPIATAADGGAIASVNLQTGSAGRTVALPFPAASMAISPDGNTGYVESWTSNVVTPVALGTGMVAPGIRVAPGIEAITFSPDGSTVYVMSHNPCNNVTTITPIAVATEAAGEPIHISEASESGFVVSADGKTAYVGSTGFLGYIPINLTIGSVGKAVVLHDSHNDWGEAFTWSLSLTPDGRTLYLCSVLTGDARAVAFIPVNTATGQSDSPVLWGHASGSEISKCAFVDGGHTAYIQDDIKQAEQQGGSEFYAVNSQSGNSSGPVELPNGDQALLVAAHGSTVYILSITVITENLPDGSQTAKTIYGTSIERINIDTKQLEAPLTLPKVAWAADH